MSTTVSTAPLTPEDLDRMPDNVAFELVNGTLVERNMGLESSEIAGRILGLLFLFLRTRPLGRLFVPDAGFQCFADDPNKVRRPDVSFIRNGRLPGNKTPKGWGRIAPDLVVEVISPNDIADEVEEKVSEWLGAGVALVWVVYPGTRTVRIHRPRASSLGRVSDLTNADVLSGEDVLPGFTCSLGEIFDDASLGQ
jgi:Uma2 family endonuclease